MLLMIILGLACGALAYRNGRDPVYGGIGGIAIGAAVLAISFATTKPQRLICGKEASGFQNLIAVPQVFCTPKYNLKKR